jgi:two-component system KDP operon response regulator KdpE
VSEPRRILVCDDEPQILRAVRVVLHEAGFEAILTSSVAEALDVAVVRPPDAAILDLLLPDGDGIEICKALRDWSEMPILMLSAVGSEDRKVAALEAGADDYLVKPFGARELVARLNAVLRRADVSRGEPLVTVDGIEVDLAAHVLRRDGQAVHLTPIEFELLRVLVRNRGRLLTYRTLLSLVWGPAYTDDIQTLRTHIANLRRKLDPANSTRYIATDPGIGYRFVQ